MPSHMRELQEKLGRAHVGIVAYRNLLNKVWTHQRRYSDAAFSTTTRMGQDMLLGFAPEDRYTFEEIMAQYREMRWSASFAKDLEEEIEKAMLYFRFQEPNPRVPSVYKREPEHRKLKREESPVEKFKANIREVEQLYTNSSEFSIGKHEGNTKKEDWSDDDLDELSMERYVNDIKREDRRNETGIGGIKQEFKGENDGLEYSLSCRSIKLESAPEIEESDPDDIKPVKLEAEQVRGDSAGSGYFIREGRQTRYSRQNEHATLKEVKQESKTKMEDVDLDLANDVHMHKEESDEDRENNLYDVHSESGEPDVLSENPSRYSEVEDSDDQVQESEEEEALEETAERLRTQLRVMVQGTLPGVASNRNWPVRDRQSFKRIIFSNALPYEKTLAYEELNEEQLRTCISFGKLILGGVLDLTKLSKQSTALLDNSKRSGKRKRDIDVPVVCSSRDPPSPPAKKARNSIAGPSQTLSTASLLSRIARSSRTDFQKRVLSALLQIPKGHHTTYAILARFLKSSARAVGNALSTNPFAPNVPCHRVLASGGGIGGFKGAWGRHGQDGANDDEKRRLLRTEGVKFDGRGRVLGSSWDGFR